MNSFLTPTSIQFVFIQDSKSWLDYSSYLDAATAGDFDLRQNIRLLNNIMKLGVEGWLRLIKAGRVCPQEIDWLLYHYSSHFL